MTYRVRLAEKPDGIFEHSQAVTPLMGLPSPAGMLCWVDVPLGVRHQTENAAGFVTQSGHVELRPVGIRRIVNCAVGRALLGAVGRALLGALCGVPALGTCRISQHQLPGCLKPPQRSL